MLYLQFGHDINAAPLFLAGEVQGAVELVFALRLGMVQERHSGGKPLFPAISV